MHKLNRKNSTDKKKVKRWGERQGQNILESKLYITVTRYAHMYMQTYSQTLMCTQLCTCTCTHAHTAPRRSSMKSEHCPEPSSSKSTGKEISHRNEQQKNNRSNLLQHCLETKHNTNRMSSLENACIPGNTPIETSKV